MAHQNDWNRMISGLKAENEKSSMLGSSIISTDAMHCRACCHQSMLWGWRSIGLCDHAAYMLHIGKQTTFVDTLNAPAPRLVGNSFRVRALHAVSSHHLSSFGLFFMMCLIRCTLRSKIIQQRQGNHAGPKPASTAGLSDSVLGVWIRNFQ